MELLTIEALREINSGNCTREHADARITSYRVIAASTRNGVHTRDFDTAYMVLSLSYIDS